MSDQQESERVSIKLTLDRIDCIGPCERETEKGEFTWSLRADNQIISERFRRLNGFQKLAGGQNIFPNESKVLTVGPKFQVGAIVAEWDDPDEFFLRLEMEKAKEYQVRDLPKSDTLEVGSGAACGLRFAFSFERV